MAQLTKNCAGIFVVGDYNDLFSTRETICEIAELIGLEDPLGEYVMGLAADLRKAYEGKRRRVHVYANGPSKRRSAYHGVRVLLPVFLAQLSILRDGLSRLNYGQEGKYANYFRLLASTRSALLQADPKLGLGVWDKWNSLPDKVGLYTGDYASSRCCEFLSPSLGAERLQRLLPILEGFSPRSKEYKRFKAELLELEGSYGSLAVPIEIHPPLPPFRW